MPSLKAAFTLTTLGVFIFSGLFLLIIERADLKVKSLTRELKLVQFVGIAYIFGSVIVFILLKYLI